MSEHTLLLPENLACLTKASAKDRMRYAVNGVRLEATQDGTGYRAEATNGKILARVDGTFSHPVGEYPLPDALISAPNSGKSALIATPDWTEAFKLIPKKTRQPILANVACVLGTEQVTFGTFDGQRSRSLQARQQEGMFPDTDQVLPKKEPIARVLLDPALLRELLSIAESFGGDSPTVSIELHGETQPVALRCQDGDQTFTGLIMPKTK